MVRQSRYRPSDQRIVVPRSGTDIELGSDDNLYARVDDVRDVSIASLVRATRLLREDRAEDVTRLLFADVPADQFFPDFVPSEPTSLRFFSDQVRVVVEAYAPSLSAPPPIRELHSVLRNLLRRYGAHLGASQSGAAIRGGLSLDVSVTFPPRRRTVGNVLSFGADAKLLLEAALNGGGQLNPRAAADLIRARRADLLVGQREGSWLDVKSEPYRLPEASARYELAKDVASFANAGGGLVLLGARRRTDRNGDLVGQINEVRLDLVNRRQYQDTLRRWLYPRPVNLKVEVVVGSRASHGFLLVEIPSQPDELKPFFVRASSRTGELSETQLTLPVRDGEETIFHDAPRIHALLTAGRAALALSSRGDPRP